MKKTIASRAESLSYALFELRRELTDIMRDEEFSDKNEKIMKYWINDLLNAEGTLDILAAEIENMRGERK